MHDAQLAEEYCDDIYDETTCKQSAGMSNLPVSLQLQLQKRTASQDWATAQPDASQIYLMLVQVSLAAYVVVLLAGYVSQSQVMMVPMTTSLELTAAFMWTA